MSLAINNWIKISGDLVVKDGKLLPALQDSTVSFSAEDLYRTMGFSYPKFFKMDLLCKWAWLGTEYLLKQEDGLVYDGLDRNKIAVVLMTGRGCLDVDKRYEQTIMDIPSPALFVYTLPNIMLGEICIRHGFKGEQACLVNEQFDPAELYFWVNDLLENRGMDACICGWADAVNDSHEVCLYWVTKKSGIPFSPASLQQISKLQR